MDIFETMDLFHSYKNSKVESLKNINIKVGKGKKTALLGANGAGKSTLFYHFNGVFKPKSGTVLFDGKPMEYTKDALAELRSDVSVMLQNPDEQIFSATVEEDIAFGMLNQGMVREEIDARIDEVLSMVGMTEYRMRPTQQLSYGQRKRVAFAGAIATHPKVLIMDEPTAGLDPQMAQETLEIADQLHIGGTDVIISTHDVDLAYAWADEIHVLRNGTLVYSGVSEGFYKDSVAVALAGLMPPAMFAIDSNLTEICGIGNGKYPHTRAELLSKMAVKDTKTGTLYGIPVDDYIDQAMIDCVLAHAEEGAAVGIYGIQTRRIAYKEALRLDYVFDGMENCLIEVMNGNDAVIYYDRSLSDMVIGKVVKVSGFGLKIPFEVRGGL